MLKIWKVQTTQASQKIETLADHLHKTGPQAKGKIKKTL